MGNNVKIFDNIHFKDLKLQLPVGLNVTSCVFEGNEKFEVLKDEKALTKAKEEGIIDISELAEELNKSTDFNPNSGEPLSLVLSFDKAEVETVTTDPGNHSGAYFNSEEHTAKLVGEIYLQGDVYGMIKDINPTEVTKLITAKIASGEITDPTFATKPLQEQINVLMPRLIFQGSGGFESDIEVKSFSGSVQHDIGNINPIELKDLPDFLIDDDDTPEDERVRLDLDNPQIFLKLTTTSNTANGFHQALKTGVHLVASQNGKQTGEVNTGDISFDLAVEGRTTSTMLKRICTSEDKEEILPEEYEEFQENKQDIYIEDLPKLLNKVPDLIKVSGNNTQDIHVEVDCEDLALPQDLKIDFEYKVFTPLSFGENFQIVYTDTEDGLSDDLNDIEDLDFGGVEITADIVSDLPLPVKLTLIPVDENGNDLNQGGKKLTVINESSTLNIAANKTTNVTINLKPVNGYKMRDFIRGKNDKGQNVPKLDGFKYKAVLSGDSQTKGEVLRTSQSLVLKNILVSLVGGITYYDE